MGGSTKKIETTPQATDKFRAGLIDYLNNPALGGLGRLSAGPVAALPSQGGISGGTQSVDQLGGANSAFFQNMMQQLAPAFNQQRQLAAAQGSESAGNLTGSGFANRLGSSLNRSLGDQQALLANYAAQGLNTEVGRQQGDMNRLLAQRGQDIDFGQGNANRFASLIGQQGTAGVAPSDVVTSGGAGALLGPLAQGLGGYFGGGGSLGAIGGGISDVLGSIFGGGGGGGSAPVSRGDIGGGGGTGPFGTNTYGGGLFGGSGNLQLPTGGLSTPVFNPNAPVMSNDQKYGFGGQYPGGTGGQMGGSAPSNILGQIFAQQSQQQPQQQNFLQQLFGGGLNQLKNNRGTQVATAAQLAQMLGGGGFNASNLGGLFGGIAGSAIPIPVLGPILGSILGKGVGKVAGKVGGGIKKLLGRIF